MNTPNNASRQIEPEDLLLYAMQLLSAEEAAVVALHLQHNPSMREELARIQGDLATYAHTAEMHSPPALARTRFLKHVARERKPVPMLRPIAAPLQLPQNAQQAAQTKPEETEAVAPSIGAYQRNTGGAQLFSFETEAAKPRVMGRIMPWVGWAAAAALAVTTTQYYRENETLKGEVASDKAQIDQSTAEAASAREVLNAMNDQTAMKVTLRKPFAPVTPMGRTTYSAEKGVLIFTATNLDPIDTFKVYELWIIPANGKDPIPAGTFHPDAQGFANFVLTNLPKGVEAKAFGITVENEGGSKVPTLPILMTGA
jgi:anti-sigma-K factor RskA